MDPRSEWKEAFQREIRYALAARQAGQEGKARVLARRAAGIAIQEYLHRQGTPLKGASAYDLLRYISALPSLPESTRRTAAFFLVKVNPDYILPLEVDLVVEAGQLAYELLGESA